MKELSSSLELGSTVRDRASGFQGVVIGLTVFLYAENRVMVQPPVDKEGKFSEALWFDEGQLVNAGKTESVTIESAEEKEEEETSTAKMKVPEIKAALLEKGFKEDDFKGMKKAELIQMLEKGIPLQSEEEPEETKEEITEDMFDQPAAKTQVLEDVDESTLRAKMVEHAKKFDKEKTFSILAKFDGATAIAQLSDNARAECYAMIEADLA